MTLPWSPAGWWLVAGAVLVTAAIVFVWRRRDTTTIVGLLARAGRGGAVERLLGPGAQRRRPGRPGVLGRPEVRRRRPAAPGLPGLRAPVQRPHPLATVGRPGAGPGAPGRAAPAGRHRHPRPGPLLPGRGVDRHRPGGRGGAAVLAPPDLQQRPRLDGDGAAGGDPEPDVGAVPAPERGPGRGHPPADPAQPLVQLEGRAVRAGRPDPVRLRADHGGPGLGGLPVQPARPAAGGPQPDLPDDQRPDPGARPRRPGAGRQPGRRRGWSAGHRPRSSASPSPSSCRPGARP